MRWLWTDDLAALVVEADGIDPGQVADWLAAPVAYRVDEADDPLTVARTLLNDESLRRGAAA